MNKTTLGLLSTLLVFSITAAHPAVAPDPSEDLEIGIQVSPSTILLDWKALGDVKITVHADVRYSFFNEMETMDVWLEDIPASYIYSDARGDLVAKFNYDALKAHFGEDFVSGPAILEFFATDENGNTYHGADEVRVVNRGSFPMSEIE